MDLPQSNPGEDGRFADNIVYFARILRDAGMPVGPAHVLECVRAVQVIGVSNREDFYWALHANLVTKREHSIIFENAFDLFWKPRGLVEKMIQMLSPVAAGGAVKEQPKAADERVRAAMQEQSQSQEKPQEEEIEVDAKLTASANEILQNKDFAQMSAVEIALAKKAISDMKLPKDKIRTRSYTPDKRGRRFDTRRTIQATMRNGGGIIDLKQKNKKFVSPPIVALCDISGSMSQYSRLFVHFLHALTEKRQRVHSFLFGTRLTNITRQLRLKDPDDALMAVADQVEDWSGGTRIATALSRFNKDWSRRVLGRSPTVLLITDGLERDSDYDLSYEMDRLHRSCRRLVWLNPLLRFEGFEAKAGGIRAMMPHVDDFRPVHSLDAIQDLCDSLTNSKR